MADFDATLYFLDEREIEYLHSEIQREYAQDLRVNIVSVLLDIFEAQPDPEVRAEVLEDLHSLMVHLLTAGHFHGVAQVLREAKIALDRTANITPGQRKKLADLPERLSAGEALTQLLQALDDAPTLPPQEELIELLDQLRPAALATVFQWTARSAERAPASAARRGRRPTGRGEHRGAGPPGSGRRSRGLVGSDSARGGAEGTGRRARAEQDSRRARCRLAGCSRCRR